jgi:hypothetical protein
LFAHLLILEESTDLMIFMVIDVGGRTHETTRFPIMSYGFMLRPHGRILLTDEQKAKMAAEEAASQPEVAQ